ERSSIPRAAERGSAWPTKSADLFCVAQTSKSAVSQVSKPAELTHTRHAANFHALPTWKSAIQQVWKPALRRGATPTLNTYSSAKRESGDKSPHSKVLPPLRAGERFVPAGQQLFALTGFCRRNKSPVDLPLCGDFALIL